MWCHHVRSMCQAENARPEGRETEVTRSEKELEELHLSADNGSETAGLCVGGRRADLMIFCAGHFLSVDHSVGWRPVCRDSWA